MQNCEDGWLLKLEMMTILTSVIDKSKLHTKGKFCLEFESICFFQYRKHVI